MGGIIVNIWIIAAAIIQIAVIALVITLIIKGIKHAKKQEAREIERDRRTAQDTIEQIERELNNRKD